MRLATVFLILLAGCAAGPPAAPAETAAGCTERPEWASAFAAEGGRGTFVLLSPTTGQAECSDAARAAARFLPASTFKLYNALVAVEAGAVANVDSVFVWDGAERSIPAWNRDHTLRTGMQFSVVWLYQRVAARVGRERYRAAFAREPFGNGVIGDTLTTFWLDNSLQISALEQIRFVDRLRTGSTAFSDATETTVRGIVPVLGTRVGARGPVRILGKTGWGGGGSYAVTHPDLGWIVGWVERAAADGGPVVFAMNVEADPATGRTLDMGPARLRIVEALLERAGVLPPAAE